MNYHKSKLLKNQLSYNNDCKIKQQRFSISLIENDNNKIFTIFLTTMN